jgi:glyoxylase-like metal-dependent hydrolase (beta-lactamase superfamily II)
MRYSLLLVSSAFVVAGCGSTPERRVVLDAAEAIGGVEQVQAIESLSLEGDGQAFNLGQNRTPDSDLPAYEVSEYRETFDFANRRWREEYVRTPTFLTGNPAPQRRLLALDGEFAFDVAPDGRASRVSALVAGDRRAEMYHHPIGLLQAATGEGSQLENPRQEGGQDAVDVVTAGGKRFTLFVERSSKLPIRIVSTGYHPNLGDVQVSTDFAEFVESDGLKLPGRITRRIDQYTVAEIEVSKSTLNPETKELAAPEPVRAAAEPTPVAEVTAEEVAGGIWYLAGQSHHSVLVEFAEHLTLIEAPQHEARTLAVIGKARELRPEKPLRQVINTHHHFDHSAGIRAAVSEGLTVITHDLNRPFFEAMVARPHTVVPDALARNPKPLAVETVGEKKVLTDGKRSLEIYPVSDSPHCGSMLMVYFPAERILAQVDAFSPPAPNAPTPPAFPFAANLLENVEKRGLRVERLLPLHGRSVPFRDLVAVVRAAPRPTE